VKVSELLEKFEQKAPQGTAAEWDPVGLLVGDAKKEITSAVVSVDLSRRALDLAVAQGANVIINHHPCIFPKAHGLSRVTADRSEDTTTLVYEAIQKGIQIIACHTNFDQCALEVVEKITASLGAKPMGRLIDSHDSALLKLSVFVPETHLEKVRTAICEAGAGHIGNYDFCTFAVAGEGTFRGLDGAKPFVGKVGELEKASEKRLETVFPAGLKNRVLKAMRQSHPYEEVAYDLYEVLQKPQSKGLSVGLGYGFFADFEKKLPFQDVATKIKKTFGVDAFMITPSEPGTIKRVGYVPGKGSSFINTALSNGCDLFITGEVGYHGAMGMAKKGMAVAELGHRHSECYFPIVIQEWLQSWGVKSTCEDEPTQRIC